MAERMGVERESRVGRLRMGMVVVLRCAVLLGDVMVGRVLVVGVWSEILWMFRLVRAVVRKVKMKDVRMRPRFLLGRNIP